MDIAIQTPSRSDRELIRRMMELYLYDFSEFEGDDLDEHGLFGFAYLDYFWHEPTQAAFIVTVDQRLAGFALIDNRVAIEGNERSMAEFFVLRKYRRKGVGAAVATRIFTELPGAWEVRVVPNNLPALVFWRKVIAAYTAGQFTEVALDTGAWTGPVFSFDARPLNERKGVHHE